MWLLCEICSSVVLVSKRVFVFPSPRPFAWSPAPAHNLYLPALAPNLCLPALALNLYLTPLATTLAPNLYLPALAPNFYLPVLVSPKPGLTDSNIAPPPICIYWPWPTIFITVLRICIYLLIYRTVAVAVVILAIVVTS